MTKPAPTEFSQRGACEISPEKVRYPDRKQANIGLTHSRERFGSASAIAVYKCRCGGWHITHRRESERGRREVLES